MQQHVAVRTSLHSSDLPTITTGSPDLDRLLLHNGQPLGSLLLIEETGNTDFASVLLRSGAAQSVLHSRMKKEAGSQQSPAPKGPSYFDTKVIVAGVDESWGGELPGEYHDKKQAKKDRILAEEKKISVQNLAASSNSFSQTNSHVGASTSADEANNQSMKIAWRYGTPNNSKNQGNTTQDNKPHYVTTLDFTTRLAPSPAISSEIEYLGGSLYFMSPCYLNAAPSESFLSNMFAQLRAAVLRTLKTQGPHTVVRIIVPSFLHPATYPPGSAAPSEAVRFFHSLAHFARTEFPFNVAVVVTLALELYPRETYLTRWLEVAADAVVHLEPFGERLDAERAADSKGAGDKKKPYQGLVHVYKVPRLSEKGGMHLRRSEYAFRVSRKVFEIDEWGIPVEGDAEESVPSSTGKKKEAGSEIDVNALEKEEKKKAGPPAVSQISLKNLDF